MGHFYDRNGVARHTVPKANGDGMRDSHVGDARKNDWLPSVTTILSVIQKPSLERYKIRQAVLAALSLPRIENESSDDFVARIYRDADEHAKAARDKGTAVHDVYCRYFHGQFIAEESAHFVNRIREYESEQIDKVYWSEKVLVAQDYAGTADLFMKHKLHGNLICDFKGQDVREDRPAFYKEFVWQIGAYVQAHEYQTGAKLDGGAVIVFDRTTGKLYPWYYSRAEIEVGIKAFNACKTLWQIDREYVPKSGVQRKRKT